MMDTSGGYLYIPLQPGRTLAWIGAIVLDALPLVTTPETKWRVYTALLQKIHSPLEWQTHHLTTSLGVWNPDYHFDITLYLWQDRYLVVDMSYSRLVAEYLKDTREAGDGHRFFAMWQYLCEHTGALGGYLSRYSWQYLDDEGEHKRAFPTMLERREFTELWSYLELFLMVYFSPVLAPILPTEPTIFPVLFVPARNGGMYTMTNYL